MPVASLPKRRCSGSPINRHDGCVSASPLSRRPDADMGSRIGARAQLGIEAIG